MIWRVAGTLIAATLALLLPPLLRARLPAPPRSGFDLAVYKDQLEEIEREVERGTLTADQADAARVEVQRRILAAGSAHGDAAAPITARPWRLIAGIGAGVPALALALYATLGAPNLPDQPYSARAGKLQEMQDQAEMIRGMVAQLTARLEKDPNDGKGWAMLGRSLRVMGQADKAAEAYAKAARLLPGDTQVRLELAGLMLDQVPQGAPLPAGLLGLMTEVAAIDPGNVDALYFLGIGAAQAGDAARARALWTRAAALLPEGSEDRVDIEAQIKGLK